MDILVTFFRDWLSGFWYLLYLLLCVFMIFYVMGIVADRKRKEINTKLKEKRIYDIESGREAEIAAMESKQILSVSDDDTNTNNESQDQKQKEEVPNVMVINSSDTSSTQTVPTIQQPGIQIQQPGMQMQQENETPKKVEEPLIINSK